MSLRSISIEFDRYWPQIETLILDVLYQKPISPDLWQQTFFDIYKVCVAPENLVGRLYESLKLLLLDHVRELYNYITSRDSQQLLTIYHTHWVRFKSGATYLDNLFNYLNTQHLRKIKKPIADTDSICRPGLEVKDLCLYLWNDSMVTPLKKQIVYLLLRDFESERLGKIINQTVVNGVVHSFAEIEDYKKEDTLVLYKEAFEKPFLIATGDFYRKEADRLRQELDCTSYMRKVLQIIDIETKNCTKFIHHSSKNIVISEIRNRMVADHSQYLYKESENIVNSENWLDLNLLYRLLKPIDGALKILIQQVQNRITQLGLETIREVNTSPNPPRTFVESFIQVYKKHSELIAITFNSDQVFVSALDKACSSIINHKFNPQQPCRSPELLAKYCDSLLRKPGTGSVTASASSSSTGSSRNLTESDIDEKLSQSIIVFKYIDDKDVFQKFYSKNMAKRIILAQIASMDAEESMINKLKQVCGYEYTAKLQRMFTGIGVSKEQMEKFKIHCRQKDIDLGPSFYIYILQNGSWPLSQSAVTTFELPDVIAKAVKPFEEYYYSTFNGRVLTWLYHHCTADLKLCFTKKQYFVTMQTFHAAILLLFEERDELTFEAISEATKLSEEQMTKHLQGLIDSKILLINDITPTAIDEGLSVESAPGSSVDSTTSQNSATGTTNTESSGLQNTNNDAQCSSSKQIKRSDNGSPVNPIQYTFTPSTKIRLNLQFSSRRTKFKIAIVQRDIQCQQTREQNEIEQTHAAIDEDRKLYIQAAIVRVMKARRVSKHTQLIQEVITLTKSHFSPSVPMIKKCIDMLIEKQYLEKKDDAFDEYKYLA